MNKTTVRKTRSAFLREPLKAPFGFKGRYIDELWQTVSYIESDNFKAACPGTISVLWSDPAVFAEHEPKDSSALMNAVTVRALDMITGESFTTPQELIYPIIPELTKYADYLCGRKVAETFVLNSLVGVDYALWTLHALENGVKDFGGIIPARAKNALSCRHTRLSRIPLATYDLGIGRIKELFDGGTAFIKIKIGRSCANGLTREEDMKSMLEWDKQRLTEIHEAALCYSTELTKNGAIRYYLDANGRYDSKERLESLIDHAGKIGALDRIEIIEEPFAEGSGIDVSGLPVKINADESAHSLSDVKNAIALGYKAVALKPIAKTMSVSFDMAAEAHNNGCECLCADLTVVPLLAEWNKQFAARLAPLSGMKCGCIEVNGDENYKNWDELCKYLPERSPYVPPVNGCFGLGDGYYDSGCGLFEENGYINLFR